MSTTPHLFFISSEYPLPGLQTGGIGIVNATLARDIAAQGWTVEALVCAGRKRFSTVDRGVQVHFYPARLFDRPGGRLLGRTLFHLALRRKLSAAASAIAEISDYDAALLPKNIRTLVVFRCHNSDVYAFARKVPGADKVLTQTAFERHVRNTVAVVRRADASVFTSRQCIDFFEHTFGIPCPDRAEIIYNPVDLSFYTPAPDQTVPGRVVFAGSLLEKKGIFELARAWPEVVKANPDATLVMAGREIGEDVRRFKELIPNIVYSTVTFTGHLEPDGMRDLLRSATVCVFPSHWEAQGMLPLEAMACGKPVIFTKDFSGPDLISHGMDGMLVDTHDSAAIADAIIRLLSDEALRERLGSDGRRSIEQRFSFSVARERNIALWSSLSSLSPHR